MKKFFTKKYFIAVPIALLLFLGLILVATPASAQLNTPGNNSGQTGLTTSQGPTATNNGSTQTGLATSQGPAAASNSSGGSWNPFNFISYYLIGRVAFGISYIIAWIGGVAISIDAWLVGAMLGINQGVFQSTIVQEGFGVTLSIANLGFVLGIIIIAIATILHQETYGYKKILWKLIAAAILVNFSLVIASPIFTLGNSFTQYFLNCVDPGAGGCSGQGAGGGLPGGNNSMNDFATKLAGAFNPQVGLLGNPSSTLNSASASISLGQSLGQMLVPILSIGFVAFELVTITIVLGTLVIMLFVRYVYIAMLAILMPFAWLGWVFPGIKDWWTKWWHEFIRWTFFAPIVVFFLWLAMATVTSMQNGTALVNQQFGTYSSNSNPIWAPIANLMTNAFTPIIGQILNILVLVGLTVGGLVVADRMSIMGAKAGVGAVQSAGKAVQGYVARKTKRVVGDRLRSAGRRTNAAGETTTALQRFGSSTFLQGIPGLRKLGAVAANAGSTEAMHAGKEEDIKKYINENLRGLSNEGVLRRAETDSFLDETESAAIGQELARRKLATNARVASRMDRYIETMGAMGNLKNEDTLKSLDNAQLVRAANSSNAFATDAQASAIAQEIAKRNLTSDRDIIPLMTRFVEAAQRTGKTQDILNNRPDLVQLRPGETRDQALLRAVRGIKDIVQIDHRVLDLANAVVNGFNPDEIMNVALHLSSGQINKLAADGNSQQNDNLRASITDIANRFTLGTLALSANQQVELNRIIEVYKKAPLLQPI